MINSMHDRERKPTFNRTIIWKKVRVLAWVKGSLSYERVERAATEQGLELEAQVSLHSACRASPSSFKATLLQHLREHVGLPLTQASLLTTRELSEGQTPFKPSLGRLRFREAFQPSSLLLWDWKFHKGSGHNKFTRWGHTMFSGRGVIQDTTYLMNHMDETFWP